MAAADSRLQLGPLTTVHWLGIALASVSAIVHLVLGVEFLPHPVGVAFLLSTAGFAGAIVLLAIDYRRRLLYLLGIPYVGVQIVLWYVVNRPNTVAAISAPEAIDKIAQALLLVVLIVLLAVES